jgi:hypothetical protein
VEPTHGRNGDLSSGAVRSPEPSVDEKLIDNRKKGYIFFKYIVGDREILL